MNPLMRDALLEMRGLCRHEWGSPEWRKRPNGYTLERVQLCQRLGCNYVYDTGGFEDNPEPPPAVGDGHEPTLEELLEWWAQRPDAESTLPEGQLELSWALFDGLLRWQAWLHDPDADMEPYEERAAPWKTAVDAVAEAILRAQGQWTEAMRGA